ncbi:MAG: S-4TM family putative pore-forming effector [Verrucomicrobia subdivision 3 bacterium]|nr:S-4TM family putative pore-forming effector [Limisphaerales bacterium]
MSQPIPTCDIPEKQNSERSLKHIAAWTHLYGHAKIIAGWQFFLSVPCALTMALIALRWPEAKVITTPLSLLFGWIDILCLDRIQNERKRVAAKMQEQFDCELFDLGWNEIRCSTPPDTELLNGSADRFRRKKANANHRDWYPVEVCRVPLPLARLICQRAAVWWDMSQRQKYAGWLVAIVAVLVVGVVTFSFTTDQRVRDMVLSVYLPIAPAVVWAVRECIRQKETVSKLEKLKGQIEGLFGEAISGRRSFTELNQLSRNIQDMMFDGRSRNPLFFDFIYNRFRPEHEVRMGEKAKEMVEAALAKQEHWK